MTTRQLARLSGIILSLALAACAVLAPALAQLAIDDRKTCADESGDVAISACGRAITSGKFNGRDLSDLYSSRGFEHNQKGDNDRAIADYNEAIRLNPKNANILNNLAIVHDDRGKYTEAEGL